MDAKSADTRPRLSHRVGALVDSFETVIYAIAFLLLVAAAILVVIGGAEAVVQAAGAQGQHPAGRCACPRSGADGSDRCGDRRHAARGLLYHEIAAEPFLFIGLIACVRRILIVTAQTEQVHSDKQLNRLLLELGALGLLVIGIAAAIFMIRVSTKRVAHADSDDG